MTWPASIVIDTVFIPIYVVIGLLTLVNIIKHGRGKSVGFISLLIFALVRIVGNVLIVVEYNEHDPSITTTVWGYILQSIGFSFLYSSSLAFYLRAKASSPYQDSALWTKLPRFLNIANIAALICIIVGQTSVSYTDSTGNVVSPHLPVESKVGILIYIAMTVVLLVLVLFAMRRNMSPGESRILLLALAVALPLMLVRSAYSAYTIFSSSFLIPKNIWVKLVLQYLVELAVIAVFTLLGFLLPKLVQPPSSQSDAVQRSDLEHCDSIKPEKAVDLGHR